MSNSFTWTGKGSSSSASDPNNWIDQDGNPGIPGTGDSVDFPDGGLVTGGLDVSSISLEASVDYEAGNFSASGDLVVDLPASAPPLSNGESAGGLIIEGGTTGTVGGDLIVGESPGTGGTTGGFDSQLILLNGSLTVDGNATVGGTAGSSGNITVDSGSVLTIDGNLAVGLDGYAGVFVDGGTLNVGSLQLGEVSTPIQNFLSTFTLYGPNSKLVTDAPLVVGVDGEAAFGLEAGASYTTDGDLILGENQGGYGDVFVYDSTLNISGDLIDGVAGTGSFSVGELNAAGPSLVTVAGNVLLDGGGLEIFPNATVDVAGTLGLGVAYNSSGTLTLYGPNAVLDVTGAITLGDAGSANFTLSNGASLSIAGDQTLAVQLTSQTYVVLQNDSELSIDGVLYIGQSGSATVDVYSGSTLQSNGGMLGELADSTGTVTIDDSTWNVNGDLVVGEDGSGSLAISDGGSVTSQNGEIGTGTSYDGTVTVDGLNSSWAMSGYLIIGAFGGSATPSLTISNQASVSTADPDTAYDHLRSGALTLETGGQLSESGLVTLDGTTVTIESGATLTEYGSTFNNGFNIPVGIYANGSFTIDDATLSSSNAYTIIGAALANVGAGTGTLTASDGATITSLGTDLGEYFGDSGTVTLTGPGTTWTDTSGGGVAANDSGFNVGVSGTGILTIEDGAVLSNPLAYVEIAKFGYSTGTAFVTGSNSILSAGGLLRVGDSGFGTLTVENGGQAEAGSVEVGDYASAVGQLIINAGSTVSTNNASMVDVGQFQGDTGPVTVTAGSFVVGVQSAAVGSVKANGGTLQVEGDLEVGGAGTGVMTASSDATITSWQTDLGESTGGIGILTLSGSSTTWTDTSANSVDSNSAGINVGVNGTGELTVEGGAVLSNPMSYIKIGQNPGATGTAIVTGTGSVLSAGGLLRVGDSGTGTLTVEDGGQVEIGSVQVGYFFGSTGEINIDAGGTLSTAGASTVDVGPELGLPVVAGYFYIGYAGQGTVNVEGGTLKVDGDITVGDGGTGRLAISAGGTVTSQNGSIGTGASDGGTVTVDGIGSSWTMTGYLHIGVQGGAGSPSLTILNQAIVSTVDPGSSIDELFSGSLTLESGGQLSEETLDMHNAATLTIESGATLTENPFAVPAGDVPEGLGANGTVIINDATLSSANNDTVIGIDTTTGGAGVGVLTASAGATINSLETDLAEYAGDSGTVTLTGPGTTWTDTSGNTVDSNDAGFNVGVNGSAVLTVEDGAVLANPLSYIKIGQDAGATGTATVTGTNSMLSAGGLLRVGDSGTGTLTVEDGGLAAAGQVQVGDFGGSIGVIDIDAGGTLTTNSASNLDVGAQLGATVAAGSFVVGVQNGAQGTVKVDGGTLNVNGDLIVGDGGIGALTISDHGMVSATSAQIGIGGTGTVTLDAGGTLTAGAVEVGADGNIVMAGGMLDPPNTITIDAGGTVKGFGAVLGNVADDGMLEALGGTLVISGAVSGGGGAVVGDNSIIEFKSAFTGIVAFAEGIAGTLRLDQLSPTTPPTISDFTVGDTINLSSVAYDPAGSAGIVPGSDNVLQIVENGSSYALDLDPTQDYVGHDFLLAPDTAAGGTDITVGQVPITGPVAVPAGETTSDVVVASGGSLTVASGGSATGTTVETGGELIADAGSTLTDSVIDYGGVLDLATGAAASGTIQFGPPQGDPVGGTLEVEDTAELNATITGFADGDDVDLTAIPYDPNGSANLVSGNVLDVTENGNTYTLQFDPTQDFSGDYFHLAPDSGGTGTDVTENTTPCYCRGTLIATARGEVAVEELAIAGEVVTMSGAVRPIKWIGRRSYGGRFVMGRKDVLPVCIKAGALADDIPRRDLWISPHHAMFLDGTLIEAKDLVNGVSIVQAEHVEKVEYFHIELETHDVIIAEGALSESFVDDDDRRMFHNAHEYRTLYPDAAVGHAQYCVPRPEDGYQVEVVRRRIARRAGLAANSGATGIGDLRGFVDRITGKWVAGWAQNLDHPEAPVCLDIFVGGALVGQVLANRYREDLARAVGGGCHSFKFAIPPGLVFAPDEVKVRRSLDGVALELTSEAWDMLRQNTSRGREAMRAVA